VTLDEVGPEQQPAHLDGIGGARGARDRAHERLVGVADVRVHHVEVALVDRHVDRLAHRAARVVQPGRGIGELDEVAEVLERAVAAPAVEVRHERRAVSGGKHRVACADLDAPRGIARVLGEFARCRSAQLIGVALDRNEPFLGQQLVRRDRPGEVGLRRRAAWRALSDVPRGRSGGRVAARAAPVRTSAHLLEALDSPQRVV